MEQEKFNQASHDVALKQLLSRQIQWEEERKAAEVEAKKSHARWQEELKLLEIQRDKTHAANEKHWLIGYGLTVVGILASISVLMYVKLAAS